MRGSGGKKGSKLAAAVKTRGRERYQLASVTIPAFLFKRISYTPSFPDRVSLLNDLMYSSPNGSSASLEQFPEFEDDHFVPEEVAQPQEKAAPSRPQTPDAGNRALDHCMILHALFLSSMSQRIHSNTMHRQAPPFAMEIQAARSSPPTDKMGDTIPRMDAR